MTSIGNGNNGIKNDLMMPSLPSKDLILTDLPKDENSFFNINDSYKSNSESYTLSKGIAAVAKIGIGLAAGDIMTKELYPGMKDKRLHSIAGGLISGVTGEVTTALTDKKWLGVLAGITAGVVAGALKEFRDTKGFGTPDKHDFYATALGSATVGLSLTIPF